MGNWISSWFWGEKITLYHYTTKEGRKGIESNGFINESRSGGGRDDARFGDGVYLTSLPPTDGKIRLAINNWDGSANYAQRLIDWGRVDSFIAVDLYPESDAVVRVPSDRDVYKYNGDLVFKDYMNARSGTVSKT